MKVILIVLLFLVSWAALSIQIKNNKQPPKEVVSEIQSSSPFIEEDRDTYPPHQLKDFVIYGV